MKETNLSVSACSVYQIQILGYEWRKKYIRHRASCFHTSLRYVCYVIVWIWLNIGH